MPSDQKFAEGLSFIAVAIIAHGAPVAPVERLIGLQSAIARGVDWLANLRRPRLLPARPVALHPHPTRQGDL